MLRNGAYVTPERVLTSFTVYHAYHYSDQAYLQTRLRIEYLLSTDTIIVLD